MNRPSKCFLVLGCAAIVWVSAANSIAADQAGTKPVVPVKAEVKSSAVPETTVVATRRITESQYRNTIADVFGRGIEVNGRFEPERREHLLLAIGSSMLSISSAGFDQYFAMAKSIADQTLGDKHRGTIVPCVPVDAKSADDKCTAMFVRQYGEILFRRPLVELEVTPRVAVAAKGATQAQDYYAGLKLALISLLTAPEFLFRMESIEKDRSGRNRLDGYAKAARLSYLMWDTTPDRELLTAAAKGELHTEEGLKGQITRLASQPVQLERGIRAFFSDMLQLDMYDSMTKDPTIFPKFSQAVSDSAKEQTLKTVIDHLLTKDADYRDLFTTKSTFIDRSLASIYRVHFVAPSGWTPYTFPADSDQSGLLTQMSVLAVFSHPGRSSPTKRGVAINEILLCEPTPTPPANVDFSIVNDTNNPQFKTVRSRLLAHSEDESCSGCHMKSDPFGLALERFDSLGQYRLKENGDLIDVSAELRGKKFEGARGLGMTLREDPRVAACLVRNVYAYGVGREPALGEQSFLDARARAFAKDGYRLRNLLRDIASSPEFFSTNGLATPMEGDKPAKATDLAAKFSPGVS